MQQWIIYDASIHHFILIFADLVFVSNCNCVICIQVSFQTEKNIW